MVAFDGHTKIILICSINRMHGPVKYGETQIVKSKDKTERATDMHSVSRRNEECAAD